MVFHDRPVDQEEHAAQLIMARRLEPPPKAEYICADLSIAPSLFPCRRAADPTLAGEYCHNGQFQPIAQKIGVASAGQHPIIDLITLGKWAMDLKCALS